MKPSVIICLFNHGTGEPLADGYCPECLKIACADKDKEIAELRHKISTDFMAGVVIEHEKRIAEARTIIQHIGYTSADDGHVIQAALKWLEGKP